VIGIEHRLPELSDKELEALHANAVRLAQSGTAAQRDAAEGLLPHIGGEMERRAAASASARSQKRRETAQRMSASGIMKEEQ
jgi:hypothetical protein